MTAHPAAVRRSLPLPGCEPEDLAQEIALAALRGCCADRAVTDALRRYGPVSQRGVRRPRAASLDAPLPSGTRTLHDLLAGDAPDPSDVPETGLPFWVRPGAPVRHGREAGRRGRVLRVDPPDRLLARPSITVRWERARHDNEVRTYLRASSLRYDP